ncbi:unnamed protein product [Effrenium voratum]|nr:unnamed protein product [Effrenium voratum]
MENEDVGVVSALANRLARLAATMPWEEALQARELLWRQNRRSAQRCIEELELRLQYSAMDGHGLTTCLASLARCGGASPALVQRLALAALAERRLSYGELRATEAALEALGGRAPLELLAQRRQIFLKEAPLPRLLRELQEEDPPSELLEALVWRLEALGEEAPKHFEDPFEVLELLVARRRLPTSFLTALIAWVSRKRAKVRATARQLCALDDAATARGLGNLDDAIRGFLLARRDDPHRQHT